MSTAPTGTVTFLFTDIEGSTQRWEKFPTAMAEAVARHDALLRSIIEKHEGMVFKTIGDAFCAAFAQASHAVEAALEAQHALLAGDWGEVAPLRVRMALHTGVAQERDNDYFGPTVNRVARILGVGHGGQTLLSCSTRELVAEACAEVEFHDLGAHRLKDLARAEQIFQLNAPGLPTEFAPLKSLNRHNHNLPLHPTPLIGRDVEIDSVLLLLRDPSVRLVTLSGPGGAGKTRLSLQIAAEALDLFTDGVYFLPLASAQDTEELVATIAQGLELRETSGRNLQDGLKDFLRPKNALLVLDNFEQIIASAALLADLLAVCPALKLLVTSQSVLRLRGEREFLVHPLALPPKKRLPLREIASFAAIELFVARAQAARPNFELNEENAPDVVEICRRLDGLPLAIELAAARVKILAPTALLGHLKNRLKLLTGGARDLPARQRTLRDAIAWSYELLEARERVLLRRLAVFQGGCTLKAALEVCEIESSSEIDVFGGLEALVDKSLLRQQDIGSEPRFALLETIREFSFEQLAQSGELDALQKAHAHFFGEWAADLAMEAKAYPSLSLEVCEIEHENLRAALDWLLENAPTKASQLVIALSSYWERQGHFREGQEAFSRCLAASEGFQNAKLLGLLGWFYFLSADYQKSRDCGEKSLQLCRDECDSGGEADALNNLALVAQAQGDAAQAEIYFEASLRLVRESAEKARQATRLSNLGLLAIEQERFEQAQLWLLEANSIYEGEGDLGGTAACLCNLGELALRQRDFEGAQRVSQRSLELFRVLKDQRGIAYTLANLAEATFERGDYRSVLPLTLESLEIAAETRMQWLLPPLLDNLSCSQNELGQRTQALLALRVANVLRARLALPRTPEAEAIFGELEAHLTSSLGEEEEKQRAARRSLEISVLITQVLNSANS